MHIFILTLGTRGDFELFWLLGRALHQRGHRVTFGASRFHAERVHAAGLEFAPIGDGSHADLLAILTSLRPISDRTQRIWQYFQQWVYPQFMMDRPRIQALAEGADYFISNLKTVLKRQGEAISGAFVTYDPPLSLEDLTAFNADVPRGRILELVAMNRALLDPHGQWGPQFHFTGFWRDETPAAVAPNPELARFLQDGPPPVVLTMGSMVTFDPQELTRTFKEALRQAGQRGVIVGGWSGIVPEPPPPPQDITALFFAGGWPPPPSPAQPPTAVQWVAEAPYDWLFPQAACVIHHGGCGTVSAVLRAGVPSILLPQIQPQQLFGQLLGNAGVAASMFEARGLDPAELADAIRRTVGDPKYRQNAQRWQQLVTSEPGVTAAVDHIEAHGRELTKPAAPAKIMAPEPAAPARVSEEPPMLARRAPSEETPLLARRAPKLLFVLSNDFGELSTAVNFVLGQPFDARFLLPPRQAEMGQRGLPVPTERYATVADVLAVVDRDRPDLVLLCSGYLYYPNCIFTMEELAQLVAGLRARSCRVLTSDPFLGVLARVDDTTFNAEPVERQMLAERFAQVHRILKDLTHLYWVDPAVFAPPVPAVGFSLANLIAPPAFVPCRPEFLAEIGADPARRRWFFVLAGEDYWMQAMTLGGPIFDDWLTDRLRETAAQGRQPVLLAPYACTSAVTLRTPAIDGLILLNECRHELFMSLLLEAEYAFYWNVFSNSTLVRAVNRQPVFFFDAGHMARYSTPLFQRGLQCYFGNQEPPYLKINAPLDARTLDHALPEQTRTMERMARCVLAPASAVEIVERLRRQDDAAAHS